MKHNLRTIENILKKALYDEEGIISKALTEIKEMRKELKQIEKGNREIPPRWIVGFNEVLGEK